MSEMDTFKSYFATKLDYSEQLLNLLDQLMMGTEECKAFVCVCGGMYVHVTRSLTNLLSETRSAHCGR